MGVHTLRPVGLTRSEENDESPKEARANKGGPPKVRNEKGSIPTIWPPQSYVEYELDEGEEKLKYRKHLESDSEMAKRNTQLGGPLPRIPCNEPVAEIGSAYRVVGDRQEAAGPTLRVENRTGLYFEKIRRWQGLAPDTSRGTPPYDVEQYIERGCAVNLLDAKNFEAMRKVRRILNLSKCARVQKVLRRALKDDVSVSNNGGTSPVPTV